MLVMRIFRLYSKNTHYKHWGLWGLYAPEPPFASESWGLLPQTPVLLLPHTIKRCLVRF